MRMGVRIAIGAGICRVRDKVNAFKGKKFHDEFFDPARRIGFETKKDTPAMKAGVWDLLATSRGGVGSQRGIVDVFV